MSCERKELLHAESARKHGRAYTHKLSISTKSGLASPGEGRSRDRIEASRGTTPLDGKNYGKDIGTSYSEGVTTVIFPAAGR